MSEHEMQSAFFTECAWRANQDRRWAMVFAIPNGSNKSPAERMKFKREGLMPGVPDTFLAVVSAPFYGLFIEFKKPGGKHSAAQVEWAQKLRREGYEVVTAYSSEEAVVMVSDYLER